MQEAYPTIFSIFSSFSRILSHTLRTPLSVVMNELATLQPGFMAEQSECANRKCYEMVALLKALSEIGSPQLEQEIVSLKNIIKEVFDSNCPHFGQSSDYYIQGDRTRLLLAFKHIQDLFRQYYGDENNVHLALEQNRGRIRFILQTFLAQKDRGQHNQSNTFSAAFCMKGEALFAPLIDAILLAHGAEIHIVMHTELEVSISFMNAR